MQAWGNYFCAHLSETSALHLDSTLAIAIAPLDLRSFLSRLHIGHQQSGCCAIALEHVSPTENQPCAIPSPLPGIAIAACYIVVSPGAAS